MNKKSFSLIELLVVIAIIGILASLILPALGKARAKSRQAVCNSQHKQMGMASYMYNDDNENYMPSASSNDTSSRLGWKDHLVVYLAGEVHRNYTGAAPFRCPDSEVKTGFSNQEAGTTYNIKFGDFRFNAKPAVKITDIESAVETVVIADSIDDTSWVDVSYNLPSENAIGNRHNGSLNLLWVDGHVQSATQTVISAGKNGEQDYYYLVTK
ncbi:prepilin-type N-terminal cleavage/methylation domain-containing protein [Lentisphaera profundi]|uniref:Prepilin-type N-terminal cleavage/methylation domain-containing protein n=1 Tax=Lentisphaera profundi TaxID=1658616 RepID=A0ABY7VW33_9BACT|nr:prepilin-type N-terminal cleavage/methylation domain-containing protein [Lentisphaera profundi]WDE97984.1 prepilin-type N-terminal cleavage/methylation domain-containing protein [Lentisphaera profundi]